MDEDKFLIHIEIADKTYGLRINRKDEKLARDAAKQIKMKYEHCRTKFAKSVEAGDLLAMVAFRLSEENLLLEEKNDTTPFIEKIQQMTKLLEAYLENK
jgi:cell division protein ZapA